MSISVSTPQYISQQQAADALGVHIRTIRRWIAAGDLPARRFGRQIRIRPEDLEKVGRQIGGAV